VAPGRTGGSIRLDRVRAAQVPAGGRWRPSGASRCSGCRGCPCQGRTCPGRLPRGFVYCS